MKSTENAINLGGTDTVSFRLISTDDYHREFTLEVISREKLEKYRKLCIPSFVYKAGNTLLYTKIPKDLSFSCEVSPHMCSGVRSACSRLSAASDKDGGCAKVRAYARGIERFPWILEGFETFGVISECCIITYCKHYNKTMIAS